MKKINLFWHKLPKNRTNYGDILGPFIIQKLTGEKINHINFLFKWYKIPVIYLIGLINKEYSLSDIGNVLRSMFAKKVIISIGSVISKYRRNGTIVWGAGLINKSDHIANADFRAVRGKETLEKIRESKYNLPTAIGDPALLLPLIIQPATKKYKIGIVPHFVQYNEILKKYINDKNILIINLEEDILSVTRDITSCEYIVSSSLHGLIVSHAYNIPALWVDFKCVNKLYGDDVKFSDYFSSVDIENYKPILINSYDINIIKKYFTNNRKTIINTNLKQIQKNLLESAPFIVKEMYYKKLNTK